MDVYVGRFADMYMCIFTHTYISPGLFVILAVLRAARALRLYCSMAPETVSALPPLPLFSLPLELPVMASGADMCKRHIKKFVCACCRSTSAHEFVFYLPRVVPSVRSEFVEPGCCYEMCSALYVHCHARGFHRNTLRSVGQYCARNAISASCSSDVCIHVSMCTHQHVGFQIYTYV